MNFPGRSITWAFRGMRVERRGPAAMIRSPWTTTTASGTSWVDRPSSETSTSVAPVIAMDGAASTDAGRPMAHCTARIAAAQETTSLPPKLLLQRNLA
jgi:hypothetical protein